MRRQTQVMKRNIVPNAYTMVELMLSIAIIGILVGIAIPSYETFRRRAEKVRCIGNLKVLHTGFDSYLLDKNQWPQMPEESMEWDESKYFGWWIKSLEPYGVGQETWLCPTDRIVKDRPKGIEEYASSYVPTPFSSHQFTPYRWNQPWVAERGDFHRKGAHVLMPDGSITTSQNPWGER